MLIGMVGKCNIRVRIRSSAEPWLWNVQNLSLKCVIKIPKVRISMRGGVLNITITETKVVKY